jgi:hypothetical protein
LGRNFNEKSVHFSAIEPIISLNADVLAFSPHAWGAKQHVLFLVSRSSGMLRWKAGTLEQGNHEELQSMNQCIRPESQLVSATEALRSMNQSIDFSTLALLRARCVLGLQRGAIALGSLALAAGLGLAAPSEASAQAAYGSYMGVGAAFGLSDGDTDAGEDQTNSAVISFRYNILRAPISVRAQLLTFSDATAFVPTVSYDIPISWQADAYIGAGVAFQDGGRSGDTSPIGNQTAFVLQPGVDYFFPYSNMVVYGNAIIAFDAYREGGDTATSLQTGVGIRF